MTFEEAQEYLNSLGHEFLSMKLGLEAMTGLLEELGSPHKGFLKVQIAGTNGKGSTCSFLESICIESGIRTGVTTSPHLVSIRERIRVDRDDISEAEFGKCIFEVKEAAERLIERKEMEHLPTFFEHVVAAAFLGFRNAGVEVAVIETGLGGRLDATTAARSELIGITRVDLDHQEFLGDTIAKIATEKAAIISPGSSVVAGLQVSDAESVIREMAESRGASLLFAGPDQLPDGIELGLLGQHQFENAAVAVALARVIGDKGFSRVSESSIVAGLEKARHPGRLEFSEGFLLDGAHNVSGAKVLRSFLDQRQFNQRVFIFGAMKGKDIKDMLLRLLDENSFVLTVPVDSPRSWDSADLARVACEVIDPSRVRCCASIDDALNSLDEVKRGGWDSHRDVACVTGSLYLIGEFKSRMIAKDSVSRSS